MGEPAMELLELIRTLYGVEPEGCTDDEIEYVRNLFGALPEAVETFWRSAGRTERLHFVQDNWAFPANYRKWKSYRESEDLILLMENQGCCRAVIRREDLALPAPPVYTLPAHGPGARTAETVSEFLEAALLYQAVWQFDYSPDEFYWLSDEELETVREKLEKWDAVLRGWMEMDITFYSNRPDNLLVIMDAGGQYQALYGGASEAAYKALLEVMDGLGEPL